MALRRTFTVAILFPRTLGQWLGPLVVGLVAAGFAGVLIIASGWLDLTASTPHPQGWAGLLHYIFRRSVAHHSADIVPPVDLEAGHRIIKGAVYYSRVCANCHAAPGLGQSPVALAMRPQPQYLVTQVDLYDAPGLFWILQHGVKYSAMPAWPARGRDDEVWSLVAFLRRLPGLSNADYIALAGAPADPPPVPLGNLSSATYRPDIAMPAAAIGLPHEYSLTRPAVAFGHGGVGAAPQAACIQCHGADGAGRAGSSFPNLTLLDEATFNKALKGFAIGARRSGYMQPVAAQLTDAQIDALQAYFHAQPRRPSPQFAASPERLALGRSIAENGVPAKHVAACQSCHDINRANAKAYPAIAGQNAIYHRDQLRLYKTGARGGGEPANPMPAVSAGLTDAQIEAVAAYYGAMAPQAPDAVAEGPRTKR